MPRGDQLTRQWRLVQLLAGRTGRTLAQLQAELSVTKRTVQRDLGDLQAAGFPVISEPRNGTVFWHFVEGFRAEEALSLTLSEMMALYFSRGLLKPLQGTGLYDALDSAMHKIGSALPAQAHNLLNSLGAGIHVSSFGSKDFARSSAVIQVLMKGVMHHYAAEILHKVPGYEEAVSRKVDPYKLWYVNNGALSRFECSQFTGLPPQVRPIVASRSLRLSTLTSSPHRRFRWCGASLNTLRFASVLSKRLL